MIKRVNVFRGIVKDRPETMHFHRRSGSFMAGICFVALLLLAGFGAAPHAKAQALAQDTSAGVPADSATVAALQNQLNELEADYRARFDLFVLRMSSLQRELQEQGGELESGIQQQLGFFEELQNQILLLRSDMSEWEFQRQTMQEQLQQQADTLGVLQQQLAEQSEALNEVLEASEAQLRETISATEQQLGTLSDDFEARLSQSTRGLWMVIGALGVLLLLALLYIRSGLHARQREAQRELAQAEERLSGTTKTQLAALEVRQHAAQEVMAQQLKDAQNAMSETLENRASVLEDALVTQSETQQKDSASLKKALAQLQRSCDEQNDGQVKEALATTKELAAIMQKQLEISEAAQQAAAVPPEALAELKKLEDALSKLDPAPRGLKTLLRSLQKIQKQLSGSV